MGQAETAHRGENPEVSQKKTGVYCERRACNIPGAFLFVGSRFILSCEEPSSQGIHESASRLAHSEKPGRLPAAAQQRIKSPGQEACERKALLPQADYFFFGKPTDCANVIF